MGQRTRLLILTVYLVGLFVATRIAFDDWIPPASSDGLWFYTAFASLLLGNLIVTPFFTKPADAVSYAAAAMVALLFTNPWAAEPSDGINQIIWSAVTLYVGGVMIISLVAISFGDSSRDFTQKLNRTAYALSNHYGNPRFIFSAVFLFALIAFHRTESKEFLTIGIAWAIFIGLQPLEQTTLFLIKLKSVWSTRANFPRLGDVVGHEAPGLVLIREEWSETAKFGDLLVTRDESGDSSYAMALDHVGYSDGQWLRAIHLDHADMKEVSSSIPRQSLDTSTGVVSKLDDEQLDDSVKKKFREERDQVLGLVSRNTTVGQLEIDLVRTDSDISEGSLVEVKNSGDSVLYQILDGLTMKEVISQKNTHGFVHARARKIGKWNFDRNAFDVAPWLPKPNALVRVKSTNTPTEVDRAAIGYFPRSDYPVMVDTNILVTHNTAILGILGVGKSFLALELIERSISKGIKFICLDMTEQYASQLAQFTDILTDQTTDTRLNGIGTAGKIHYENVVEDGGSTKSFELELKNEIAAFLDPNQPQMVRIFDPGRFEVWKQDSKWFSSDPDMAKLTPAEITRMITEAVLAATQDQGMTDDARCCIVYEEAHSLIPEWNAAASGGDSTASNGTARAILQGRKFGMGCLVITQRTASVTKSILNQCNTIFGMRVFDETAKGFLSNYIGDDYSRVLSNLPERHAVVFGKASSCHEPILIELNDRETFINYFRRTTINSSNTSDSEEAGTVG
jgi:hypothetical protein